MLAWGGVGDGGVIMKRNKRVKDTWPESELHIHAIS